MPCCPRIETSQMICAINQLIGFYMKETLSFNVIIHQKTLELRIQNFQGMIFIWTRTYSEVFQSALVYIAQKMKFYTRIWSHLLQKSFTENFIFCAVVPLGFSFTAFISFIHLINSWHGKMQLKHVVASSYSKKRNRKIHRKRF